MENMNDKLNLDVKSSITGATQTVVERLRTQTLEPTSLLFPFINKLIITAGRSLFPFVDLVNSTDTTFVIGAIELTKSTDFTIAEISNETREDANLTVGIDVAIQNILDIQMVKRIEKKIVDALVADTDVLYSMSLNWDGIKSGILAMGKGTFSIAGTIYVGVSLNTYFTIVEQTEFVNAMKVLGNKIQVVVMEEFTDTQMLVLHEHGVVGGLKAKALEKDSQPGFDRVDYIAPFVHSFGWDSKYVKFSN
jgi:hypothetical protein